MPASDAKQAELASRLSKATRSRMPGPAAHKSTGKESLWYVTAGLRPRPSGSPFMKELRVVLLLEFRVGRCRWGRRSRGPSLRRGTHASGLGGELFAEAGGEASWEEGEGFEDDAMFGVLPAVGAGRGGESEARSFAALPSRNHSGQAG